MAVVYLLLRTQRLEQLAWQLERGELLNRIQHPERPPVAPRPEFLFEPDEPDEVELIGTIADPKGDG